MGNSCLKHSTAFTLAITAIGGVLGYALGGSQGAAIGGIAGCVIAAGILWIISKYTAVKYVPGSD